jgi:iron complex transport system substrate-binding protein
VKIAWLLLVTLAACAAEAPPPVMVQQARVVALVPAATEIIAALGRSDALVGRAEEDSARYVAHLPSAGPVLSPSTERVVELQPDVVIAWPGADPLLQHMRSLGVRTLAVRLERISDVAANIRAIGRLLAVTHTADSLAEHIAAELEWLRQKRPRREWPTVLYLLDTQPFWTAGPNTFVDDLIQLAGGINIFADLPTQWSEVSLESVIARQPDVIIVAQPDKRVSSRNWLDDAGWRRLRAVQNRRVYFVDADLFNRPGPNVVETARRLVTILHSGSPE